MKNLHWGQLTDDILEILVLNQKTLAEKCRVTQQSVSNWKTGVRKPGVYARHTLRQLAEEAKLSLDDYKISNADIVPANVDSNLPDNILSLAYKISHLNKKQQEKIIDMAEFMISKGA